MGTQGGIHIDRDDLKQMMGGAGDVQQQEEEKKLTKGAIALRIITIVLLVAYLVALLFGAKIFPEDSGIYESLNIFSGVEEPDAFVRALSYAILTLAVSRAIRIMIGRMAKDEKITKKTGVAIIELLGTVVKYVTIVILVLILLSALGVDTAELFAGLGILGLIIGLGVTSLVEDIVAGVFIIWERLFDVGDIVVVDDFRGTVLSIGIRSTQIVDEGGDVLILRNSQIENLVNMTNRSSYAICDMPISPDESIERVEELITQEFLTEVKNKVSGIDAGPFYLGLSEVNEKGVKFISFVAVCDENSKYRIQRGINRELIVLFERNGIELGEKGDDDD